MYKSRNALVINGFEQIMPHKNLKIIRPGLLMCGEVIKGRCLAIHNGKFLYYDDDHLSHFGSDIVVKEILKHIN